MSMDETLFKKFHALPATVKDVVSSREAMDKLAVVEEKHGVTLGDTVVRLVVKDVLWDQLPQHLIQEKKLSVDDARAVAQELEEGILQPLVSYLQAPVQKATHTPTQVVQALTQPIVAHETKTVPQTSAEKSLQVQKVSAQEKQPTQQKPAIVRKQVPKTDPVQPAPVTPRPVPAVIQPISKPVLPKPVATPVLPVVAQSMPTPVAPVPPLQKEGMQQPPALALRQLDAGRKAAYFISAEDEEDVAKHREHLQQLTQTKVPAQAESVIDRIIADLHLTFSDPAMEKRCTAILLSRLHNARTKLDVQDMLGRSLKIGGMGYDAKLAETLATEVDKQALLFHDLELLEHPQTASVPALKKEEPPKPVQPVPIVTEKPPVVPASVPAPIPVPQYVNAVPRQPVRRLQVAPHNDDRPVMQDIKQPPRPMGLVEELAAISLQDFRKFGTPVDAAHHVLEKISLLTEDSFLKRSEGIQAWRSSEIYRLYLMVGQESMATGKSIETLLTEKASSQVPSLTPQEFAVIADINKQLTL